MKKEEYFDENNICTENEKYILRKQSIEDKHDYFKLCKEVSIISDKRDFDFESFFEWNWEQNQKEDCIYVSVVMKESGTYVGNIVLRNLNSTTPEVGIEILTQYRRSGIASHVIPLFIDKIKEKQYIEYFLVRIYSDNIASIGLFKKLKAVEFGKEPSELERYLIQLKEKYGDNDKNPLGDLEKLEQIAGKNYIAHYKLI